MQHSRSAICVRRVLGHFGIALLTLALLTNTHAVAIGARPTAPANPHAAPNVPSNLTASANGQSVINLQWADNSGDEDGFAVERSLDGATNWAELNTAAANVMTFDNSGLTCAKTFFYRVYAYNADGGSVFSNVASATTGPCDNITRIFMPSASKPALITQAARLVDVSLSLYNTPTDAARPNYEGVIRYFADGVYEMSNGAHKIRRFTIYTNGQNADQANIIWRAPGQCWPNATIAGYSSKGARIEMCDSNSSGEPYVTANDADQQNAGYTTAHEWGHYFYGISDEYKASPGSKVFGGLGPLPGDTAVQNSVMNQQRNAILGTTSDGQTFNGDFNWLNFDTRINNTGNNSQFRLYGASAWDTLLRSSTQDPRDADRDGYNPRDSYPELASFAPLAGQSPSIELPAGRASARSELQIVWIDRPQATRVKLLNAGGDGVVRQIVIASSASMTNSDKLEAVKAAVKDVVEGAEIGDVLGIIQFNATASTTYPLTVIANQSIKDAMETAIDAIALGSPQAAIGEALQKALDGFATAGIFSDTLRTVYLIADGSNSAGRDPFGVVQSYANAFVTLHTFGYGTGGEAAASLQRLAEQTGGDYHFVSDSDELWKALGEADEMSSPVVDADIAEAVATAIGGTPLLLPFHVDASVDQLKVDVAYAGDPVSATLILLNPTGVSNAPDGCEASEIDTDTVTFCSFSVNGPSTGVWKLQAVATETLDVAYAAIGTSRPNTNTFNAVVEFNEDEVLISPTKMLVRAQVQKDWPITNLIVSGTVELPNGTERGFALRDDGVAPDTLADDGIYMAQLGYAAEGDYFVTVRFDNKANTGKYTQYSINLDGGRDGLQPIYFEPWPVNEAFERVATAQISVVP